MHTYKFFVKKCGFNKNAVVIKKFDNKKKRDINLAFLTLKYYDVFTLQ